MSAHESRGAPGLGRRIGHPDQGKPGRGAPALERRSTEPYRDRAQVRECQARRCSDLLRGQRPEPGFGTPADPPVLQTAVPNRDAEDTIPLDAERALRVVGIPESTRPGENPVLVVESTGYA